MKLMHLFKTALLLPLLPLIGTASPDGAHPPQPGSSAGSGDQSAVTSPGDNPPAGGDPANQPKSFTQDEVNRMMAAEKNQGRRSVLAALGIPDDDKANEALTAYKTAVDAQKTDLQREKDNAAAALSSKTALEQENAQIKNQLAALSAGVNPEHIADITAIAQSRVTDQKTFEQVITELKGLPAYHGFFVQATTPGTGASIGTGGKATQGQTQTTAADRLKAMRDRRPQKSHYFSN